MDNIEICSELIQKNLAGINLSELGLTGEYARKDKSFVMDIVKNFDVSTKDGVDAVAKALTYHRDNEQLMPRVVVETDILLNAASGKL